jgi:hypothetical protein
MGIVTYIGAIASAVLKKKQKRKISSTKKEVRSIDIVSKAQFLKWGEEGKCQCCGKESGEFKGICDECRLS